MSCQSVSKKQRPFKTDEKSDYANDFRVAESKWTPPCCSYYLSLYKLPKATVRILIILSIGRKFGRLLHYCLDFIKVTKPF